MGSGKCIWKTTRYIANSPLTYNQPTDNPEISETQRRMNIDVLQKKNAVSSRIFSNRCHKLNITCAHFATSYFMTSCVVRLFINPKVIKPAMLKLLVLWLPLFIISHMVFRYQRKLLCLLLFAFKSNKSLVIIFRSYYNLYIVFDKNSKRFLLFLIRRGFKLLL